MYHSRFTTAERPSNTCYTPIYTPNKINTIFMLLPTTFINHRIHLCPNRLFLLHSSLNLFKNIPVFFWFILLWTFNYISYKTHSSHYSSNYSFVSVPHAIHHFFLLLKWFSILDDSSVISGDFERFCDLSIFLFNETPTSMM